MTDFQMACNRVVQACGCTAWDQLEAGTGKWVRKYRPCHVHTEDAATETEAA